MGLLYIHLVDHSAMGAPPLPPDEAPFFVPGPKGYTDHPALAA